MTEALKFNVNAENKTMVIICWLFAGTLGGHRLAAGDTKGFVFYLVGFILSLATLGLGFIILMPFVFYDLYQILKADGNVGITTTQTVNPVEMLEKYHTLYQNGAITEYEYGLVKKHMLSEQMK